MKSDDSVMDRKRARRDVVFLKTANDRTIQKRSSVNFSFCRTGAVAEMKGAIIVASDSVVVFLKDLKGNEVSFVSVESEIAGRVRCQKWQEIFSALAMKLHGNRHSVEAVFRVRDEIFKPKQRP